MTAGVEPKAAPGNRFVTISIRQYLSEVVSKQLEEYYRRPVDWEMLPSPKAKVRSAGVTKTHKEINNEQI